MKKLTYLFIRMWAPPEECDDSEEPHYVQKIHSEGDRGELKWTVSRIFEQAHFFKHLKVASRILRSVKRLAERLERGWNFEIIQVEEEIVESNRPVPEEVSDEV